MERNVKRKAKTRDKVSGLFHCLSNTPLVGDLNNMNTGQVIKNAFKRSFLCEFQMTKTEEDAAGGYDGEKRPKRAFFLTFLFFVVIIYIILSVSRSFI